MYIQILTMRDEPLLEVADDLNTNGIDEVVRLFYGVQGDGSPHDWIGDPGDLIRKQWYELQRINLADAEFYQPDAARDSEESK